MTIAFALTASNGVLVVADGRTTSPPTRAREVRDARTDLAVKIVRAPHGLPWVVAASGRASIGGPGHEVSTLVREFLEASSSADLAGMTFGQIISSVRAEMERRAILLPAMFEDGSSDPVHILVAGFTRDATVEVWKSVGPRRGDVERSYTDVTFCGLVDDRADGESAEDRVLVLFDREFLARNEDPDYRIEKDYYLLRGQSTIEVAKHAKSWLFADVEEDSDTYTADGIGGQWLFVTVEADSIRMETASIGPMKAPDAPVRGGERRV